MFFMDLKDLYKALDDKLNQIDFFQLQNGFKKYEFILYTQKEYCLNHCLYPNHSKFYGNTALEWEGRIIAIWNVEDDFVEDIDVFTANLVHEMYHCFQMEQQEKRFPNDLILLSLPLDNPLCQLRYQDSRLLIEGYYSPSLDALKKIYFVRREMLKINQHVEEEFKSESIEGVAEYIGLQALKQISLSKYEKQMEKYCAVLNTFDIQLSPRKRSYYSGCLFLHLLHCLCLDVSPFSDKSFFDSLSETIPSKNILIQEDTQLKEQILKEEESFQKILVDNKNFKAFPSRIVGYDPMNMKWYKNYFLCKGFLLLDNGTETKTFQQPILLKMGDSISEVLEYCLIQG